MFETQGFVLQGPVVLKPESSGTITVKSPSVYDKPVIDPKYGSDPLLPGIR